MTHRTAALAALLFAAPLAAADKPAATTGPTLAKKPWPGIPDAKVVKELKDYQRYEVAGFRVMVHNDVLGPDGEKYDRKPLDVLELEFRTVEKVLPARTVELFRRLVIWVEWDQTEVIDNGRNGTPVAVYRNGGWGGNWSAGADTNALDLLKNKTITVLSMKSLTEEHQPDKESGRCVLLHELSHVVHDQLIGRNNPQLRAAYQRAMQMRLYDLDAYVTTSEAEFFAELSTSYYDQCRYFPQNRDTLKRHDPVTHQMLEGVWGVPGKRPAPPPVAAKKKPGAPAAATMAEPAKEPELPKREALTFGDLLYGTPAATDELDGKVALVFQWGKGDAPHLTTVARLVEELGPLGFRAVAGRADGEPVDKATGPMKRYEGEFTVVDKVSVGEEAIPAGKALLFDPEGKCVFQGLIYDALPKVRGAVGAKLLADLKKPAPAKGLATVAKELTSNDSPYQALPKVAALSKSADADTAADAKALLAPLTATATEQMNEAKGLEKSEPLKAFLLAEKVSARYKGSVPGAKAAEMLQRLRGTPPVAKELKARKELEKVQQLDNLLMSQDRSFNPADTQFQERYKLQFAQLREAVGVMRKKYPSSQATVEAERVAKFFGLEQEAAP